MKQSVLPSSKIAIVSQQLVPNKNNESSLALEVLINTPSIKALIRENNIHQIDNYILSGQKDGMVRMDDSLFSLYTDKTFFKFALFIFFPILI